MTQKKPKSKCCRSMFINGVLHHEFDCPYTCYYCGRQPPLNSPLKKDYVCPLCKKAVKQ